MRKRPVAGPTAKAHAHQELVAMHASSCHDDELAELTGLSCRQVNRLSTNKLSLPAHAAEMTLRLLEVHEMAVDVFGSRANACAWLSSPHPLLEDECPRSAMKTSYGAARVKDLLVATKYGGVT